MAVRSVHRPFEDRERQELGSPEERLQDSSDPDTGSEEEGNSRLSPPHSPRGETCWGAGVDVGRSRVQPLWLWPLNGVCPVELRTA